MTATINTIARVGYRAWRYTFSTDVTPATGMVFRVYQDGRLMQADTRTDYIAQGDDPNVPPIIEVLDSTQAATAVSPIVGGAIRLQWIGDVEATNYVVERYVSGSWTAVSKPIPESGRTYYHFTTDPIEDGTAYLFRVTALDSRGAVRDTAHFAGVSVCAPAPPDVVYSYDSEAHIYTVAERT